MPTRQEILMGLSYNRGLKEFRFWLNNTGEGNVELEFAPDGWNETKIPSYERNSVYKGVIRKTTAVTLMFVKDGRDYIGNVYNVEGVEGEITFTVKRLDTSDFTYGDYYEGLVDLSTLDLSDIGADVQIIDNSFTEKFKNRENLKVNWYDRDSISNYGIAAFTDEDPVITFPAYNIIAEAVFSNGFLAAFTADHIVPVSLQSSEFDETQTPNNVIDHKDGAYFLDSTQDRVIKVTGNITGYVTQASAMNMNIKLYSIVLNLAGGQVSKTLIDSESVINNTNLDFDFDLDYTVGLSGTLQTDESVLLQAELITGDTYSVAYTDIDLFLSETLSSIVEQERKAFPIYEALLRVAQIITDSANPFYSDFFGRTDTPLTTYGSDGHLAHVTKGRFIRGETLSNTIMPLSMKELFQSFSSILNLGLSIEKVSGVDKIRIEELSHFFSSTVVLDLSSRINENSIRKKVLPDWHYNEVKVGFKSFAYEEAGGLYEYNTKTIYSTVLKSIKNVLDIVCNYRGDTMGINKLRQTGITDNPSEDVSGDEDIFVLKSVRGSDWLVETDEAFDYVTGGVDANQSYNLPYTPARNVRRYGMNIRAGLENQLNTFLKFLTKEKNTKLVTKLTADAGPLSENANFEITNLDTPLWVPEAYVCEVPFDGDDIATIEANLKGLIKLSATKYGWILSINPSHDSRKAELRLLRCNLDYVMPV
jgi:hypothetical protein